MSMFGIPVSLLVIAYVVAIVVAFAILHALDVLPEVVLPLWMHHGTFGLAMTLVVVYFLMWFGFVGLILSIFFSEDLVFTFALCAGFASLMRGKDGSLAWA
jgi:hypothetical protein